MCISILPINTVPPQMVKYAQDILAKTVSKWLNIHFGQNCKYDTVAKTLLQQPLFILSSTSSALASHKYTG